MVLPVTLATGGALGLLYVALSLRIVELRVRYRVSLGERAPDPAQAAELQQRVRAHANLGEFAPFLLILLGLIEQTGASRLLLGAIAVVLVLARLAHAIGIHKPAPNPYRAVGTFATFAALGLLSLWALWLAVQGGGLL